MKTYLVLLSLCLLLWQPDLIARNVFRETSDALRAKDYARLDAMYAELRHGPFSLTTSYPESYTYFRALLPRRNQNQSIWERRLNELEAWLAAEPDSRAAKLALAYYFNDYAWAARGGGFSHTVGEQGWIDFRARRSKGLEILSENAADLIDEPFYYYINGQLLIPSNATFPSALRYYQALQRRWPDLMLGYMAPVLYMLPRWHGEYGDIHRYAKELADARGGEEGDALYALLVNSVASYEKADLIHRHGIDVERTYRGLNTAVLNIELSTRWGLYVSKVVIAMYAEDDDRLKEALLLSGFPQDRWFEYRSWEGYRALLEQSGADQLIDQALELERNGDLIAAEAVWAAMVSEPHHNVWLDGFYLRNQMREAFVASPATADLDQPLESLRSIRQLTNYCSIYLALGDYEQARAVADRIKARKRDDFFDWGALFQIALFENDTAALAALRQGILDAETRHTSCQLAQDFLRQSDSLIPIFDWSETGSIEAATLVALELYRRGDQVQAQALLDVAFNQSLKPYEQSRLGNLRQYPPLTITSRRVLMQ